MANPYQAGQALGSALFGSTQDTYTNQLGRQYQVEQALQEARQARSKAVLANQINEQRALITPDLLGSYRGGDAAATNQLIAAGLLANDKVDFSTLGDIEGATYRRNAVDRATLGDWDGANASMLGVANGPQELAAVQGQNLINNRFLTGGGGISTTEQGRAGIAADAARARASDASAANSFASAAKTRQEMAQGASDTLGSPRGMKAPSGYRWLQDGSLQAIPGGPADKPGGGGGASLPVGALKELLGVEEALGGTEVLGDIIGKNRGRLKSGTLDVGPGARLLGRIRTGLNMANSNDVNLSELNADKTKIVNESLRLNKGVQTEGDAIRAGEELMAANDAETLKRAFDRLEEINSRAIELQRRKETLINSNYGRESTLGDPPVATPARARPGLPAPAGARRRYNPATGRVE